MFQDINNQLRLVKFQSIDTFDDYILMNIGNYSYIIITIRYQKKYF